MKLVTFNIRCAWNNDGINSFRHRAGTILWRIREERPDIVAFQECTSQIMAFLRDSLPEYTVVFNQRNADLKGEGLATALRKEAVELLGLDAFWLSPTPFLPGSRYEEQSNCPRICQCLTLRCEDKVFRVYNLHLDHVSDLARRLGMEAALRRVKEDRDKLPSPLFLLGDLNATPDSGVIAYAGDNPLLPLAELTAPVDYTFHAYGNQPAPYKIDYIFSDADTADQPHTVSTWTDEDDGIFLSDHYPVALDICL